MSLPSDDLKQSKKITWVDLDAKGISVQDALAFQELLRARSESIKESGVKILAKDELDEIDLTLSVYVAEKIRKGE